MPHDFGKLIERNISPTGLKWSDVTPKTGKTVFLNQKPLKNEEMMEKFSIFWNFFFEKMSPVSGLVPKTR